MKFGRKRFPKGVTAETKKYVLAIDVGGTKISGAIVNSDFEFLSQKTIPSRRTIQGIADSKLQGTKGLIAELCAEAEMKNFDLVCGGAGFPEYVNLEGLLTTADNIDWQVQPQQDFSLLSGFPWVVQSDVRCAGIAEAQRGAGRGVSDFVYITVSSGISHTHFLNASAVTGSNGEAIGFGMTEVDILGQSHILENYCSGLGIARRYADQSQNSSLDARALMDRFEIDSRAREIVTSACEILGTEMAKLAYQLSTQHLVLGGGLWLGSHKYRELVLNSLYIECKALDIRASVRNAEVEHSGVIGAAIYAYEELD